MLRQDRWQRITFLFNSPSSLHDVMVDGVIQPLLAMGQSVTALIDHDRSGAGR